MGALDIQHAENILSVTIMDCRLDSDERSICPPGGLRGINLACRVGSMLHCVLSGRPPSDGGSCIEIMVVRNPTIS